MSASKKNIVRALVLLVALAASICAMAQKEGWHIDEVATLGLSNGSQAGYITAYDDSRYGRGAFIRDTILGDSPGETAANIGDILSDILQNGLGSFSIRDRYIAYRETSAPIWKSGEEFAEYLSAEGFSAGDVYINQILDTHPPLYYLLVRAAYALGGAFGCAGFTLWPAFWVNALMLCLCCLMCMRIGEKRFGSFPLGAGAALFFALSPAGLSLAVYMRMYMTLCFFVLASLDAHLALWQKKWEFDRRTARYIAVTCALGFLTHYYFAIWAVMCALVCFGCMLAAKCERRLWGYIGRMAAGVGLSLIAWPFSPVHLLLSNRSAEAVESLSGGALSKLGSSLDIFTNFLFGRSALVPAAIAICGLVFFIVRRAERPSAAPLSIVFLPAALYLCIVFVIAPYEDLRYMACAVPLVSLAAAWCIWQAVRKIRARKIACCGLCACIALSGLITQQPMYLYPGTKEHTAFVQEHEGRHCLFLTSSGAAFYREMPHFAAFEKVLIVNRQEIKLLAQDETLAAQEEIVLYIHDSYPQTETMRILLEQTGFTQYEVLAQSHEGTDSRAYLLRR